MEGPASGPDAPPQTGIPWQYWRGSQAQLTASTAPMPWVKRSPMAPGYWSSYGGRTSKLTSDDEHLQRHPWKLLSLFSCAQSNWVPSSRSFTQPQHPQAPPCWDGKMELSPTVWTGRKEQVPPWVFSRRYQKGVLRDCVPMLKEHRVGHWIPEKGQGDSAARPGPLWGT